MEDNVLFNSILVVAASVTIMVGSAYLLTWFIEKKD